MTTFTNLAGALFLYPTGCSLIHGAPFPDYALPTQAPANPFAVPGTALAGAFLPISLGQGWSPIATDNARRKAANFLNGWPASFDPQLDRGPER